jgi:hypothetical protein
MNVPAPPGWYPDPGRAHQHRYFDGRVWTDHVSDNGVATLDPLAAAPPPGLVGWHAPGAPGSYGGPPLVRVSRAKMWIFSILSLFVFRISTNDLHIAIPFGILFAISCWQVTKEPLRSHEQAGSPAVGEIKAARWIAVGLAILSSSQALLWFR